MSDDAPRAEDEANAGLLLLMQGALEAGLARYLAGFMIEHIQRLPIGLHIHLLENAGRRDEAQALRTLAVRKGGNIALRHVALQAPPEEAVSEYEALFAGGIANAQMVNEYLGLLGRLGRVDDLQRWLAPDLLFRKIQLDPDFAGDVKAAALAREDRGLHKSLRAIQQMRRVMDLHSDPDPVLQRLFAALTAETEDYFATWRASAHPLAPIVPETLRLKGWALIARGEGIVARHIHPRGWMTGVYYPNHVPEGGGELRVSGRAEGDDAAKGWFEAEVAPRPGLLVLMPSFYTHWTVPPSAGGLRISIAFDVRGLGADEDARIGDIDANRVPL